MKHLRPLFCVLAVLAVVLILSSCDGDKTSETPKYTVMVPQFAEGNSKDSKIGIPITPEMVNSATTVRRFFAYRVAPPITGFKEQKITDGGKVTTSIFGNPISLTMTIDEDENFVFEGLRDNSEYIKVVISKDNKSFYYAHSMILDVDNNIPNTEDECDVVVGAGNILSSNHFDSYGTAYYLAAGGDAAQYKFLLHGKADGKMAWFCYDGRKWETQSTETISFNAYDVRFYMDNCAKEVDDRVADNYSGTGTLTSGCYVAEFDKDGLIFDSLYSTSALEKSQVAFNTNGVGESLGSPAACVSKIKGNGQTDYNYNWDIIGSVAKWNENVLNLLYWEVVDTSEWEPST